MIVNPYIKDSANIQWLEENEQTFLDYMSKHHSLVDVCHTILHLDTLDDAYISNMITLVESFEKKRIKEEKARRKKISGKIKETATEKKIKTFEEIADKIENQKDEDILFD